MRAALEAGGVEWGDRGEVACFFLRPGPRETRRCCASCQAKRAALLSEHIEEVLARVAHRRWVFTIPSAPRGPLARRACAAARRSPSGRTGLRDGAHGFVASIQKFGQCSRFIRTSTRSPQTGSFCATGRSCQWSWTRAQARKAAGGS
ncbi:MAG: hypothetical protein ACT4PV_02305 [Planctomycetaceae bacterium]